MGEMLDLENERPWLRRLGEGPPRRQYRRRKAKSTVVRMTLSAEQLAKYKAIGGSVGVKRMLTK